MIPCARRRARKGKNDGNNAEFVMTGYVPVSFDFGGAVRFLFGELPQVVCLREESVDVSVVMKCFLLTGGLFYRCFRLINCWIEW